MALDIPYLYPEDKTCCCATREPAYDEPLARQRRRKGSLFLSNLAKCQIVIAILSIISGLVSIGVAVASPSFPIINGMPILTGSLILGGGLMTCKAMRHDIAIGVTPKIRACIIGNYVINVTGISFSCLTAAFSVWAVVVCFSTSEEQRQQCHQDRESNIAINAVTLVLSGIMLVTCILGTTFLCRFARSFGFYTRMEHMKLEIQSMQAEVEQHEKWIREKKHEHSVNYSLA